MTNKEKKQKLTDLISGTSGWLEKAEWFDQKEDWLNKSAHIALRILRTIREQSMSQKDLADRIDVSPQYINKIVKGKENLSLVTICKIERVLGVTLIETPADES